tara:strand:+ start:222 stop:767 length:546 start_codon:yes stop_codon:yes gene_type:complete
MCNKLKILIIGVTILPVLLNCTSKQNNLTGITSEDYKFSVAVIDSLQKENFNYKMDYKLEEIISEWTGFKILNEKLLNSNGIKHNLKTLKKTEIKEIFKNLEKNLPTIINSIKIFSRINVLESTTLILHDAINNFSLEDEYVINLENNMSIAFLNLMKQIDLTQEKNSQIILQEKFSNNTK